jgi:hypothetical protein
MARATVSQITILLRLPIAPAERALAAIGSEA